MKRYLWTYTLGKMNHDEITNFSKIITEKFGITDLFLSMNNRLKILPENFKTIADTIETLYPINVHPMLFEDPEYAYLTDKNKLKIKNKLRHIQKYNEIHTDNLIQGIHVDIEPHALKKYKDIKDNNNKKRELFHSYRNTISFINKEIAKLIHQRDRIIFSAAVAWWYEKLPYASSLYLDNYIDEIVPMIYNKPEEPIGKTLNDIKKRSFDTLNQYFTDKTKFVLGMGYEFSDYYKLISLVEEVEYFFSKRHPDQFMGIALFSDKKIGEWLKT